MRIASEENDAYFQSLANKISRFLPAGAHLCDAGCGLGYLSTALAPYCKRITAIDIDPRPLAAFEKRLGRLHRGNIGIVVGDIREIPPAKPYDAMVFCLFSRLEKALCLAREQCRGPVMIVKRNRNSPMFSLTTPGEMAHYTFEDALKILEAYKIPYLAETFALEMGQPFRSTADAVEFFRIYNRDKRNHARKIRAKDIETRLICRPGEPYPYYFPALKEMGMIVLETDAIPDAFKNQRGGIKDEKVCCSDPVRSNDSDRVYRLCSGGTGNAAPGG